MRPEHREAARLADARARAVAQVERGRQLIEARRPRPAGRVEDPAHLLVVLTETVEQRRERWRTYHAAAVERARADIARMSS